MRQVDKESKTFFWFMMLFLTVLIVLNTGLLFGFWGNAIEDEYSAKKEIQSNVKKFNATLKNNKIDDVEAKFLIDKQEQFNEEADFFSLLNSPEKALYDSVDELSKESEITSLQKQKYLTGVKIYEKESMANLSAERLWGYVSLGLFELFLLLASAFVIYVYTDPKDKSEGTWTIE